MDLRSEPLSIPQIVAQVALVLGLILILVSLVHYGMRRRIRGVKGMRIVRWWAGCGLLWLLTWAIFELVPAVVRGVPDTAFRHDEFLVGLLVIESLAGLILVAALLAVPAVAAASIVWIVGRRRRRSAEPAPPS